MPYNVGYKTLDYPKGVQMNAIQVFDNSTNASVQQMLVDQHNRLGQLDPATGKPLAVRSITARNYDSSIKEMGKYLRAHGYPMPTKSALESWRDSMLADGLAVSTAKARLAAARKLLRAVADDCTDLTVKMVLNDWAKVTDPKATHLQDKIETDYGKRLTLESLRALIASIPTNHIKGLRDRALIAVMVGAGLRVSEAVNLTIYDMLSTTNESGQRGIYIRKGKHNKSRVVVLNGWNSWVIKAVETYLAALELTALQNPTERVFRGVHYIAGGQYISKGNSLDTRNAHRAIQDYQAEYQGEMVLIAPHDLRRTYAKLSKQAGMSWEALSANLGHSSITVTEKYVGKDVDWTERVPNWTIDLEAKG
jgi:site-specific recombinase XerD